MSADLILTAASVITMEPEMPRAEAVAVDTSATVTGSRVSDVISHAAATSFIHIVRFAASEANHKPRKTVFSNGVSAAGSGMPEG